MTDSGRPQGIGAIAREHEMRASAHVDRGSEEDAAKLLATASSVMEMHGATADQICHRMWQRHESEG